MPAPKGNKNAVDNDGGRPPKFKTAEELENKVEEYFVLSKGVYHFEPATKINRKTRESEDYEKIVWDVEPEPITITGLALHLGFCDRQSLNDYEKNIEFSFIIKKARMRVENSYEKNLHNDKPSGSIFALKVMGWQEKNPLDEIAKKVYHLLDGTEGKDSEEDDD